MEDHSKPLFIRPADAAKRLSVSLRKTYELIAEGALPSVKIGASIRIPLEAIERMAHEAATQRERAR